MTKNKVSLTRLRILLREFAVPNFFLRVSSMLQNAPVHGVVCSKIAIKRVYGAAVLAFLALAAGRLPLAYADAPNTFTYQGRLKVSNSPVNGNASIAVQFCNAPSGGTCYPAADNTQTVAVSSGLFRAVFNLPTDAGFNLATGPWYLQIYETASGSALSNPLSPREQFTSSPYAMYATSATYANGLNAASGASIIPVSASLTLANNAAIAMSGTSGTIVTGSSVTASAFFGDASHLSNVNDLVKVAKAGDTMTGDLQIGQGTNASTYSASGYLTLANLASAPATVTKGRIYFDSTGNGALKISLDGVGFVPLSTGSAGGGISSVVSDAGQFTGTGVSGNALTLKSSSVTLQGNAFNGANQLVQLNSNGGLILAGSSITLSGTNGYMTSGSSIIASAFFGNGANLTGIAGSISGGVSNFVSKYTGATTLGTSSLYDNGTGVTLTGNSTMSITGSAFSVGGSTLVVVNGNVGIGTTNPTSIFHVLGNTSATAFQFQGSGANANPALYVKALPGAGHAQLVMDRADTGAHATLNWTNGGTFQWKLDMPDFTSGDATRLDLDNSASLARVTFLQSGNVGIGTTSPAQTLDVNGPVQFGSGVTKSTFNAAGGLFMAPGSSITLSGANGYITSGSSIIASAFFGNGANLTGISGSVSGGVPNFVSKYTGATTLGTSSLYDSGTGVTLTGNSTMSITGSAFSVGGSTLVAVNGNVGIGTTGPVATLNILGPGPGGPAYDLFKIQVNGVGGQFFNINNTGHIMINPLVSGGSSPYIGFGDGSNPTPLGGDFVSINPSASSTANLLNIQLGNASRMLVTPSGNVGIGTNLPAQTLDVNGSAQFGSGVAKSTFNAAGGLFIASGSSITLSGTNGYITSGSSIIASAFYGNGTNLTGISGTVSGGVSNFVSKYTGATTLATSSLYDNGTGVTVTGNSTMSVTGNAFSVGGSTLVVAAGSVGIGTSTLTTALEVATPFNGSFANAFRVGVIGATYGNVFNIDSLGRLTFQPNSNYSGPPLNFGAGLTSINNTDFMVVNPGGTGNIINLQNLGASRMVVTTAGNVGISSTAPQNLLVVGSGTSGLNVTSSGNVGIGTNSPAQTLDVNGGAQFGSGATKSTFTAAGNLLVSGNVGIGTSGPASALDVNGGAVFRSSATWVGIAAVPQVSTSSQGAIYFDSSSGNNIFKVSQNGSGWRALFEHGQQYFPTNGTFTVPPNISNVFVTMCGGGGGGGGGGGLPMGGTGGGGAVCVINYPQSVTAGNSITVTVGSGGGGGSGGATPTSGGNGNPSSFGSFTGAAGNGGGANGCSGGSSGSASATGGFVTPANNGAGFNCPSGTTGGSGVISAFGQPGAAGAASSSGGNGGFGAGGGGGGASTGNGGNGGSGFVLVSW